MIRSYTDNLGYHANFKWIDVVAPNEEELEKVALDYSLEKDLVLKCLAPHHLPKIQDEKEYYFIVLRTYDETSQNGDAIQAYTNKIIIFINEGFLITIHRTEEPCLVKFLGFIQKNKEFFKQNNPYDILLKLIKIVILSFETPLHNNELSLDAIEKNRFSNKSPVDIFNDIYYIKRSTSIVRRTLWQSNSIVQNLYEILPEHTAKLNLIKENSDRLQYLAEELEFTSQNIVSLHISVSSHKTAEVMRTLAIFSVFFMPLTFIVGIYGMNFTVMPELNWKYGYPAVLVLMIFISMFLYLWFKKKGWYNFNRN